MFKLSSNDGGSVDIREWISDPVHSCEKAVTDSCFRQHYWGRSDHLDF